MVKSEKHLKIVGSGGDLYIHPFRKRRHQPKITRPGSMASRCGGFLQPAELGEGLQEVSPEMTEKSSPWAFPVHRPAHGPALPAMPRKVSPFD